MQLYAEDRVELVSNIKQDFIQFLIVGSIHRMLTCYDLKIEAHKHLIKHSLISN
jgi:hypothetical protein